MKKMMLMTPMIALEEMHLEIKVLLLKSKKEFTIYGYFLNCFG